MANPDDTASTRASFQKPRNPLGRPFWTLTLAHTPKERLNATLAGIAMGIHTLARLLANNEAFREAQASSTTTEPGHWPLDEPLTEGLFAALYFLSEQAELLTDMALDATEQTH